VNFTKTFVGRPNTVRTYTSLFNHWIDPHVDETKLNANSVYYFLDLWGKSNLNPQTIKVLTRLLKWYLEFRNINVSHFRQISRNIARDCRKKPSKGITKEQANTLLEVCKKNDDHFYPILLLGLHTGMRRGEIYGLRFEDLDFLKGHIHVRRSYNGPTKTGLTRKVPMSKELEKVFLIRYNFNMRGEERLFPLSDPNPTLTYLCGKANIPRINFHMLRHAFCTFALDAGISPRQVADLAGHSKVSTTIDLYWDNVNEDVSLDFLPNAK
jgi:integrase